MQDLYHQPQVLMPCVLDQLCHPVAELLPDPETKAAKHQIGDFLGELRSRLKHRHGLGFRGLGV